MVSVELNRYEAETGDLPEVCMRCGEPATVRKRRQFTWHPEWIYLLIPLGVIFYAVAAAILTQKVRCTTLLCPRHRNHFRDRTLLIYGPFFLLLALFASGFILRGVLADSRLLSNEVQANLFGWTCIGVVVFVVCWLISIPIIQGTAIRATDITEERLRLKGVSPFFVVALEEHRQSRKGAFLEEDHARKFQPRRGGQPEEGGEQYY